MYDVFSTDNDVGDEKIYEYLHRWTILYMKIFISEKAFISAAKDRR